MLEPIEIAAGHALESLQTLSGRHATPPTAQPAGTSRTVLERILREAMEEGSVSISFSGGQDSSLLLALATAVARREGYPDPLPLTMRHSSPESREDEHQEAVIRHLGIKDWLKVDVGGTLDVLGDLSTGFYLREGILAPPNAYLHLSMTRVAPQGTLLTGAGGDEVLGTPGWRLAQVLVRRTPPRPRDLALMGYACAPTSVRRLIMAHRQRPNAPWLRPAARREVQRRLAAENVCSRVRWDVDALFYTQSRTRALMQHALDRVGADSGMRIASPLADERFVRSFAGEVGMAGPVNREAAMRRLAGDVLPEQTLSRRTKASLGGMIWGERFRDFVAIWEPDTLDPSVARLIDPTALRAAWQTESPWYQSMLLVQQAWLGQRAARAT